MRVLIADDQRDVGRTLEDLVRDPAARIILVTAWSSSDETGASGAIAILAKPIDLGRLNAALNSVAETLSVPSPAEMPIPEVSFQQDLLDYSQPVPQPSPVVPPSLEMSFHVDAPRRIVSNKAGKRVR